jgi:hypothetical protein
MWVVICCFSWIPDLLYPATVNVFIVDVDRMLLSEHVLRLCPERSLLVTMNMLERRAAA